MSKHGTVRAVLAGAAVVALAGCTGIGTATAPDVPGEAAGSTSTATISASGAAPGSSGQPSSREGATSVNGTRQNATSQTFVKADSVPFPVAVGNTWVYRTTTGGLTGRTTNMIVSAEPGPVAYQVTMASTTAIAGATNSTQAVYFFYPDGSVGYPVPTIDGGPVVIGSVRWPDAGGLASGRAYHSTLRIQVGPAGLKQNVNVTVQGAGTASVSVPAGTYLASVVHMTITAATGSNATTETIWIAQGVGPVKFTVLIRGPSQAQLTSTSELLSFAQAPNVVGDGS
jgi:hypothetical protein